MLSWTPIDQNEDFIARIRHNRQWHKIVHHPKFPDLKMWSPKNAKYKVKSSRCWVEHIDENQAEGDKKDNSGGDDVL